MKDQVVITKEGKLGVAIPLFRMATVEPLENMKGHSIYVSNERPAAYCLDGGFKGHLPIVAANFLESVVEFLGDL